MIEQKDFIFTGLQSWDIAIGSNCKDIAIEVSKHNRVLYINTPFDVINYLKKSTQPEYTYRERVIKRQAPALRQINENLWVLDYPFTIYPLNFLPDGCLFDTVNRINNKKMYSFVNKILQQLQFKDYTLFIDNDIYRSFYAAQYLKPSVSIYYRRDKLVSKFWSKHVPRLEPMLCSKSDMVFSNSEELASFVRPYNERTFNIGQGVDLVDYDAAKIHPIPSDIERIKRPIIGYVGMIVDFRLDGDLIYEMARKRPNYSFVMVGTENVTFQNHKVHSCKNVIFLGNKPPKEIPAYVASFDICMNPQKVNEVTMSNYPRKIDEYLAMGKPVVATKTDTMSIFTNHVQCCTNESEYVEAIDVILHEDTLEERDKRIQFAKSHSWKNCVAKIYNHIEEFKTK